MAVDAVDVELDERAGQRVLLPRRGLFAGAQADDDIAQPHRLAGAQRHFAALAITLVEQAHHRHALGHRRAPGRKRRCTQVDRFHRLGAAALGSTRRDGADRRLWPRPVTLIGVPAEPGRDR